MNNLKLIQWVIVALLLSNNVNANLLSNGSFEVGSFSGDGNNVMILPDGSTAMADWSVIDGNIGWIGPLNPWPVKASEGDYFLDLTDYPIGLSGGVSQDIATIVGQSYELIFDLGSSTIPNAGPSSVVASAGSVSALLSATPTVANQWDSRSLIFSATDTTTTISFTSIGAVHAGSYIGLDNVEVNAIPEPSSIAMIGLVSGCVFFIRRRLIN